MKTQDIRNMAAAMQQVAENQKAAMQKKLAKSAASSEKGKAAVTLPKAPFDIPKEKMEAKKLDPVGKADADIDNDGDVDKSDKYLHNRRKAIGKAMKKENEVEINPTKKKDKAVSADQMEATKVDEISMGKMQNYAKAAAKDVEQKRNKVKAALDQPASAKHANAGLDAMKGLTKRSKGSDMYVNKMTGRSKVKPTAEDTIPPVYAKILEKRDMHMKGATPPETMDDKLKGDGAKKMMSDMMTGAKYDETEEKGHKDVADAGRVTKGPSMRKGDNKGGDKAVINKPEDVTQKGGMKG